MNTCVSCLVLALGLASAGSARAQAPTVFRWIDKNGDLHVTDTLAEVPEPYHGMYAAKLRERQEQDAAPAPPPAEATPAPAPAPEPTGPSIIEQEAKRRREWKALVAFWRAELARATDELAQIDQDLGILNQNAVLRETPQVRAQINELEDRQREAKKRLEAARKMLLTDLPARAKKEGVPPGWLL